MAKTIIIETAKAFDAEQALNGASIGFVKDNKGGDKVTLVQYISNFTLKKRSSTNEIYYTGIGSEDGVKLFLVTRGNEVYQWCIDISELHYFAWLCSQVINNHKLVTHHVSPIAVVPFAPHC